MTGKLARSAGLIGLATLASRVLGLVRDVIQAIYFGTSQAADAFGVATRIPTLLRDLFAEGAMSAAFVPTFSRYLKRDGRDSAWRLGSHTINGLLIITGGLVLAGILFADPLVRAFAPGFAADPDKLRLTVLLTRVNMPFLTLIAVAAVLMGMLNGLRRFFVPALSPALYNVLFIAATAALTPLFMANGIEPAMSLSIGMLLGGLAQVLVQWPALRREGYQHQWILDPKDPGFREILILMGPGSLGVAAAQINLLVNTSLATSYDGAVSGLQYAFRLMYMPIGIFSVSVATAAIPDLARSAADNDHNGMRATLSWALRLMLMLSVPATVGLMVLSGPIVELIYERGAFGADSTALVAAALLFYAPGIIGYSIVKIASPAFYSLQDAKTPIMASLVSIAANLVLNLALNAVMQYRGLALGTAIAANINAGLLLWFLARRIGGIDARRVAWAFAKILLASGIMGVAAWQAEAGLRLWLDGHAQVMQVLPETWRLLAVRLVRVLGAIGAGMATLALAAWVMHIEEFRLAIARVRARIGR
jgi:putative peptidoglycan lipid II flippase